MTEIPHFDLPFRFDLGRGAVVNEQDSEEEIADCVETIVRYRIGQRPENPTFGIPDQTFALTPDLNVIHAKIEEFEPRAFTNETLLRDVYDPLIVTILEEVSTVNE